MSNIKILCIDTTSEFCSVSLFENDILIENSNSKIERSHSKLIIKLIDHLLKNSKLKLKELDAFYDYCSKEKNLEVIGLMIIPPNDQHTKKYFEMIDRLNNSLSLKERRKFRNEKFLNMTSEI